MRTSKTDTGNMTPGLYVESVADGLEESPAIRACQLLARHLSLNHALSQTCCIALTPQSPTHLWVSMLHVNHRGAGHGGDILNTLCAACDLNGVSLELHAVSLIGTLKNALGVLDQEALSAFYRRRGFVDHPASRNHAMTRQPGSGWLRLRTITPPVNDMAETMALMRLLDLDTTEQSRTPR